LLFEILLPYFDVSKAHECTKIQKWNNMANGTKELRVRECPDEIHRKIKKYVAQVFDREGRELNKQSATVELLAEVLKNIE
jgi:hypothetical protein